ncbi:NAD(P)/FAD-dependent oxidoreductase [Caldanaerobacter subterraneus]|jgi:glycerol-3-phosphate dehydrogenase|uniref:Glycerol-3-phosphate dehydrogenase n=2 Tax=Caldanaerobacter subterraneus TaxID=911092 RepID=A0A4R2KNP7_9THEO|nr:NAD(P)/FAD-dependent oxidoreductase [Caldanaerobacter subterraneus]KKC29011.1 dehydrogenase [Caldanaerobacter subterraneus subsp. pacificus DSM 12653]TCO68195.1 glycerol-3-phosphate dehydrogenase [Caldanaerobacter subterraneus]
MVYDVLIVGAGVVGCSIARELSKYKLKVIVVEKGEDAASEGASKANSAILHAGYDPVPGTLKAKLNVRGNEMFEELCKDLDVPMKRTGSLVVAFSEEEIKELYKLFDRGIKNGVKELSIITKDMVKEIEPYINDNVIAALYAKKAGIISPYVFTIALAENAAQNGVEFSFNSEVVDIKRKEDVFVVKTPSKEFYARYVVNAAGVYSDVINNMVGAKPFSVHPRKGEYLILDKDQGYLARTVIFQVPTKMGKGILVSPTIDGNLLIGPTSEDIQDKEFKATTREGLNKAITVAKRSVDKFDVRKTITQFTGLRATPDTEEKDFIIGESDVKGFINVAGIESPGFTAAPAIAEMVRDILKDAGLELVEKDDFNPKRKPVIRFVELSDEEKNRLIKENPAYGRIVCRCETVTEGEVIDAIRRPVGAKSVDGVKRRVRAGMGRCQGSFCGPRIVEILARELNISPLEVTKHGRNSYILAGETKKFLLDKASELLKKEVYGNA